MNIIIFGPQGSGKGTQAKMLAKKLGFHYLSTGIIFRQIAETDPDIHKIVNMGKLPSDEQVFPLVKKYIKEKFGEYGNIIFDGYPRNIHQYELLKDWFKQHNATIDYAVWLNISDKEAVKRLSARRNCPKCKEIYNLVTKPPQKTDLCDKCGEKLVQREDDQSDAIKKRLELYKESTEPLVEVFRKEGILHEIDGERPISLIFRDLLALLQ